MKEARDAPQSPRAADGGDVCDSDRVPHGFQTSARVRQRGVRGAEPSSATWSCSSEDEPTPGILKIMDFDGKQYYVESSDDKGDPIPLRALGRRIEDAAFLSLHELGKKDKGREWVFLQYALPDTDHLSLRAVDANGLRGRRR